MKTENNKLIAEFMGAYPIVLGCSTEYEMYGIIDCINDDPNEKHFFISDEMNFHTSWEWLMPVVEKIGSIENKHGFTFSYSIHKGYTVIESSNYSLIENEIVGKGETSLEATYKAVVEFIKWYNENK